MTRTLSAGIQSEVDSVSTTIVDLIELQYWDGAASQVTRFTTASYDIDADVGAGVVTFSGYGGFLGYGEVNETTDRRAAGMEISLDGVDQTIVAILLNNFFRGSTVKVWRAWMAHTENLIPESQDLTTATGGWTETNLTVTNNQIVAPDGTTTGAKLTENSADATHIVRRDITVAAGSVCMSAYIKEGSGRNVGLALGGAEGALFDPTDGSMVNLNGNPDDYGSEDAGDGWWRVWFSYTSGGGSGNFRVYLGDGSTWTAPYQGDGTSHAYVWGVQVEGNVIPSTYQPTFGSAVTGGGVIDSPLLMFTGFQNDEYTIEENWGDEGSTGTVNVSTRVTSRLSRIQASNRVNTNEVSHNEALERDSQTTGDTFFQNVSEVSDTKIFWGTPNPTLGGDGGWDFFPGPVGRDEFGNPL